MAQKVTHPRVFLLTHVLSFRVLINEKLDHRTSLAFLKISATFSISELRFRESMLRLTGRFICTMFTPGSAVMS